MFPDRSVLERCFRGFVLPGLENCSAVWCSAADTHHKLLGREVSGVRFLTGGMFECDIAHRRSVAIQYMLYKIRCNPVHPLNGALPGAGCWKLSAIAYVAVDGLRHLESPATYNRSSFRCKWRSYPWRNLRQARRCLRICYAIAGGSAN